MKLKIAIPKGRINEKVVKLLADIGIKITANGRSYRPISSDPDVEIKILKSQNIPKLVELGSQDVGFTGLDWVKEQEADVTILSDLGFDPVKVVSAVPKEIADKKKLKKKKIVVATEYENLSRTYLEKEGYDYTLVRTYGATEVFPPEDADMIIDNVSTGRTLKQNGLEIVDTVIESSTVFIANKDALSDSLKKQKIDCIMLLIKSVLAGRERVLVEMNVSEDKYKGLFPTLPCMKSPTVSPLLEGGYAVKIAVKRKEVAVLLPQLKENGAEDILVYQLENVIA